MPIEYFVTLLLMAENFYFVILYFVY